MKKILVDDDDILDKVVDKITKIIGIEKLDDSKILIDTDDKLPDDITLKNDVILSKMIVNRIIKDESKFYSEIFLQEV